MLFTRKSKDVTSEDAAAALAAGRLTLVDVRNADERADGSIAGSLHIPLDELPRRLGELASGQPVAFVCRSGAQALNVSGGMLAWRKAGLATVSQGRTS